MKRDVRLVLAAVFCCESALASMYVAYPLTALKLGADSFDLGLLAACGSLIYAFAVVWGGKLGDRFGLQTPPIIGCLVGACIHLITPHCVSLGQLYACRAGIGLIGALQWPMLMAWLTDLGADRRHRTLVGLLAWFNLAWAGAELVIPRIAGQVYLLGPGAAFGLASGFLALGAGFLVVAKVQNQARAEEDTTAGGDSFQADRFRAAGRVANLASYFTIGICLHLFADLGVRLGFTPPELGLANSLLGGGRFLGFALMMLGSRWLFNGRLQLGWQLLALAGGLIGMMAEAHWLLIVAFALVGLNAGFSYWASIYYAMAATSGRAAKGGWHEAFIGVGAASGPLLGGWLAVQTGNLRAPFALMSVLVLATIVAQAWLLRPWLKRELAKPK